jgi:hypothetical protein
MHGSRRLLRTLHRLDRCPGAVGLAFFTLSATVSAQTPRMEQEVGTVHWGSAVVWFRATNAGAVQVFASTGYRSAFAQPVILSAGDVERWATALDYLDNKLQTNTAFPVSARAGGSNDDPLRIALGGGDLVLEMQPSANGEPRLHAWIGVTRPDMVGAVIFPNVAEQGALMLRDAIRVAASLHASTVTASALAPPPAADSSTSASAGDRANATPVPSSPVEGLTVVSLSPRPPELPTIAGREITGSAVASPTPAEPSAPRGIPARTPAGPLVARTTTTQAEFGPAVPRATARQSRLRGSALPVLATTTAAPLRVAAPALATVATSNAAARLSDPRRANLAHSNPHPSATTTSAVTPTAAGVDDATVQNLVEQWRSELMYCYTQYGLRAHAGLAGSLVVRVALSPNGAVGHSVIGSRNWNGDGGGDVEGCIHSRVSMWHFPPAPAGSVHEFPLRFTPK